MGRREELKKAGLAILIAWTWSCGAESGSGSLGADASRAEPSSSTVVSADGWVAVPAAEDPFVGDGELPDLSQCSSDDDYGVTLLSDRNAYEVYSSDCPWFTAQQPALLDVTAGGQLRVSVGHSTIYDAQGVFTAVLQIGDAVVWEKEVTVPIAEYGLFVEEVPVDAGVSVGDAVFFHLSLDGTYTLPDEAPDGASKPLGSAGRRGVCGGDSTPWAPCASHAHHRTQSERRRRGRKERHQRL